MKKVVTLLFVVLISSSYFGQENMDGKAGKMHETLFGFSLGANYSNLIIQESPIANGGVLKNAPGFQIGILMESPLSERVSIVPKAELSFRGGQINFDNDPDGLETIGIMSTTLDAIVHFNFKISHSKLNPYIVLGPAFSYELRDQDHSTNQFPSGPNLALDMGVGFNRNFEYFGFAPELRYSFGLINVNHNPIITSIYAHSITLAFNFKG